MPSINTSSQEVRKMGRFFCSALGCSEREYRKMLSAMRKYLDVVEVKTSSNNWDQINYAAVPSKANVKYMAAFMKHDEERRKAFLDSVSKGEQKINAGVLYPHDIVHKYYEGRGWSTDLKPVDQTVEELWKALPDYINGAGNTIVVADGSGSMTTSIGGSGVTALEVANALAIYFAEHSSGEFKDKYITFSDNPQLVDFSNAKNLHEKLRIANHHSEVSSTNIEAVFDLILDTAVTHHSTQNEIPKNILIISDMEFNSAGCITRGSISQKLFQIIERKYNEAGYKLPRLVFWNVNSRTGTIPVKENELGVALVSGFSTTIAKMVLSNEVDPYKIIIEQLMTERYTSVREVVSDYLNR